MTAKTQQERSAKSAAKRAARGETILRLPALQATKDQLLELMQWHGFTEQAEVMSLLILNAHSMGAEGSAPLLAVPRHEITVSETVARNLRQSGAREAARLDAAE